MMGMGGMGGEGGNNEVEMANTWIDTIMKFQQAQMNGGDLMGVFGDIPPHYLTRLAEIMMEKGVPITAGADPAMIFMMVPGMRLEDFGRFFGEVSGIPGELMQKGLEALGMDEGMANNFTVADFM